MNAANLWNQRRIIVYRDTKYNQRRAESAARLESDVVFEITFQEERAGVVESTCSVCYFHNFTFGYCNFDPEFPVEISDPENRMIHKVKTMQEAIEYILVTP